MRSLNRVQLLGNLGRDPEMRSTQAGTRVANFSLATSEQWTDKNSGEKKEQTEWHRVVVFNEHVAEILEKYARKGSKIYIEGQLRTRKWTDDHGVERYSTEIVLTNYKGELIMLDGGGGESRRPPPADSQDDYGTTRPAGSYDPRHRRGSPDDLDDDIPF